MPKIPLVDAECTVTIPRVLTTMETMKTFKISRETLMEGVDRNEIEVMRPNGKSYLFDAVEVYTWLKRKKRYISYRPEIEAG